MPSPSSACCRNPRNSKPQRESGADVLSLLLDEHISPRVAAGLRRRIRALTVYPLKDWEDGAFLGQDDASCLMEAAAQGLTFVTYDRRTIPPLLKTWAEQGIHHAGIIFIDDRTI